MGSSSRFWVCLFISPILFSGVVLSDIPIHPVEATILLKTASSLNVNNAAQPLSTWDTAVGCSSWHGIACDGQGYVTDVDLTGANLTGTLPTFLFQLSRLGTLLLGRNAFYGSIPETLGNLVHLTVLEIYDNNLTGTIPRSIGRLKSLSELRLAHNRISGAIPNEISGASSLTIIDISSNKLNRVLPIGLGNLPNLRNLYLQKNSIIGPIPQNIGNLKNIQFFDLSNNNLSGYIPTFSATQSLQGLYLSRNSLSGSLPQGLGQFKALTTIDLSYNQLTGSIPAAIGTNPVLRELILNKNSLTGSIPNSLFNLNYLQILDLSDNKLSGQIPAGFGSLQSLTVLNLARNQFIGSLPYQISNMHNLIELDVSWNNLTGTIPSSLWKLSYLQNLYLHKNGFSGSIPAEIGEFPDLINLDWSFNKLKGRIPKAFKLSSSLQTLNLRDNSFYGPIPSDFNNFLFLEELDLKNNGFTGPPPSGPSLNNLDHLDLSNNFFGDSSFSCTSNITSINNLDLSSNCLPAASCTPAQRSTSTCSSTCNASQQSGACAGQGSCLNGQCQCDSGYVFSSSTCVKGTPSYTPTGLNLNLLDPPNLSRTFRYTSHWLNDRVIPWQPGNFQVQISLNWADFLNPWDTPDYKSCAPSWAAAPNSAVAAAYAIYTGQVQPPDYSVNQTVQCTGPSTDNCTAGSSLDALQYAASGSLQATGSYSGKCSSVSNTPTISHFEEINFLGLTGIFLALQRQPVLIHISANCPAVIGYTGGILRSSECQNMAFDHTVLLVGYNTNNIPPYWIIRNSWGPNWGENGYMRLSIDDFIGNAAVLSLPAYIPVFKISNNVCNNGSLSSLLNFPLRVGIVNPCGIYNCSSSGSGSNTCNCGGSYVTANDPVDNSQVCVLSSPCSYFPTNPCIYGSCLNAKNGQYTCLCPTGFVLGKLASNKLDTCVPGAQQSSYTVPNGVSISCSLILQNFGLRQSDFVASNPSVGCSSLSKTLSAGTQLSLPTSNSISCSVWYSFTSSDKCASVKSLFSLSNFPNPDLDCSSAPVVGQQVCVIGGTPPSPQLCSSTVNLGTDPYGNVYQQCKDVVSAQFKGNNTALYSLNPGINCGRISTPTSVAKFPTLSICTGAVALPFSAANCAGSTSATVASGETCQYIYKTYFLGNSTLFSAANNGALCDDKKLFIGAVFCVA